MSKLELVFYTTKLPNRLLDDLSLAGYEVFEAMAFSEVLHICEHHDIAAVLIGPEIHHPALSDIQQRRITLRLQPESRMKDVIWELSHLFPAGLITTTQ